MCSLNNNFIGGHYDSGNFVATTEGIIALCEGLKGSSVTSLGCAAKPQVFAFVSAPLDTPSLGRLDQNWLCGVNEYGRGTYTTEGITKLCEALKGSAVTSLRCAAAPQSVCFRVSAH